MKTYKGCEKLFDEIKDITSKFEKLSDRYDTLEAENKELRRKVDFISNKMQKE
jgi:hypothetical protein